MKIKSSQDQKLSLKGIIRTLWSFLILASLGLIIFLNLNDRRTASAAVTNDYRSIATGNWNSTSTWQRFNGSSWVSASSTPTSADEYITIQSGHTVTLTGSRTVDQVIVASSGTLVINSGVTMTIANGTSTDLDVFGTVRNAGTITRNASAIIEFNSGGKYQHNFTTTAGTIPTSTWSSGSYCEIIGYTTNTSAPSGLQSFYHFTWNCPSQSANINLGGGLTTVNGDLNITSTGSAELIATSSTLTLNVGDDFLQSAGTFTISNGSSAVSLSIGDDFTLSSGSFKIMDGNNTATVNIDGDMNHTGGTILENAASGTGNINFTRTGTQIFNASGHTVTGTVNFTVTSGSILDFGTNIMTGNNFTLASGGGVILGSTEGISLTEASGNIQVSGTRSFNTGADYTYDASGVQNTGTGLPSTVRNLSINNSNGVTLFSTVSVTGTLYLITGKVTTGANELRVTNTSTSAINGYSSTDYVIGNLRRTVSGTGSYYFPIGTSANYEVANINLSAATGFSTILATFTNTNPEVVSLPLTDIIVEGILMQDMLSYGYWTFTPNSPMTGGSHTITIVEKGQSNGTASGCIYTVLRRNNSASSWVSDGTHASETQSTISGYVIAVRSVLNTFGDFGIAFGELLSFQSPTLLSGTAGNVNAVYKFPNVCSNVDAWVQMLEKTSGVILTDIDDNTTGYPESWQPFLEVPANTTGSILWKITLKIAGTSTDTTMDWVSLTAVDVDGGTSLREFVEATQPYSYSLSGGSQLTVSNTNNDYRATSSYTTVSNIDTAQSQALFQIKYNNTNFFYYRTGIINNTVSASVRQTSLYFKSFLPGNEALPIKLVSFDCVLINNKVNLSWCTASEINNSYFTVERSADGMNFESIIQKPGAGNSTIKLYYKAIDDNPLHGYSYYRLKQTDFDGKFSFSSVETINNSSKNTTELEIKTVSPNPFTESFKVSFNLLKDQNVKIGLFNSSRQLIAEDEINGNKGINIYQFPNLSSVKKGIYFIIFTYDGQQVMKKVVRE
jgi:hypothetical protein